MPASFGNPTGECRLTTVLTSQDDGAMHLRHELDSLGAPSLGIVVNRVRTGAEGYYGYGYAAEPIDLKALERA